MKEIINYHIGQAGVQMGSAMWELFCVEHVMNEHGQKTKTEDCFNERLDSYFSDSPLGRFVPRGIFIDLEPTVVDEIKMGAYRDLYHPDRLITGMEDAASNFARGFFTVGKILLGKVTNENRKICEACDQLQAVVLHRSLGGGTGAGLTSALFDVLADYPKTPKIDMPIFPAPTLSTSTVEPYNALLAEHFCIEDTDISLLFDNEALYDISSKYLCQNFPTYTMINHLIVQVISSVTAALRFQSTLNCDVSVLQVNLVPFPRIHFPLCNYAPMTGVDKQTHETNTVDNLTRCIFEPDNQMVKIDLTMGRLMSCALIYRGAISPYDIYGALSDIKRSRRLDFVEWCPTGFKVGINLCPPMRLPESHLAPTDKNVAMLTNSSAIGQAFQRLSHKFYLLYAKRSFLHWFVGEGMEEIEFTESLFNITALVKDYEEVTKDAVDADKSVTEPVQKKSDKYIAEPEQKRSDKYVTEPEQRKSEKFVTEPEQRKSEKLVTEPVLRYSEKYSAEPEQRKSEKYVAEPEHRKSDKYVTEAELRYSEKYSEKYSAEPEQRKSDKYVAEPHQRQSEKSFTEPEQRKSQKSVSSLNISEGNQ